jgi:hypothetical protein
VCPNGAELQMYRKRRQKQEQTADRNPPLLGKTPLPRQRLLLRERVDSDSQRSISKTVEFPAMTLLCAQTFRTNAYARAAYSGTTYRKGW